MSQVLPFDFRTRNHLQKKSLGDSEPCDKSWMSTAVLPLKARPHQAFSCDATRRDPTGRLYVVGSLWHGTWTSLDVVQPRSDNSLVQLRWFGRVGFHRIPYSVSFNEVQQPRVQLPSLTKKNHGITMVLPWYYHGFTMVWYNMDFWPRYFHGITMVQYHGTVPWYSTMVLITMVQYHGITMVQYHGTMVIPRPKKPC